MTSSHTRTASANEIEVRLRRIIGGRRASKYVHALPPPGYFFGKALCGAEPSRNSAWGNDDQPALDCPHCKACIGVQRVGDDFVFTCTSIK